MAGGVLAGLINGKIDRKILGIVTGVGSRADNLLRAGRVQMR